MSEMIQEIPKKQDKKIEITQMSRTIRQIQNEITRLKRVENLVPPNQNTRILVQDQTIRNNKVEKHRPREPRAPNPNVMVLEEIVEEKSRLKKSLYELNQSPRMWYKKIDTNMFRLGFTRRKEDHCVYFKLIGDHLIYLVLYVDCWNTYKFMNFSL